MASPGLVALDETKEVFPSKGTAVLCSSSSEDLSIAPFGGPYTRFSEALFGVLLEGNKRVPTNLSLHDVGAQVRERILEKYPEDRMRPEVHSAGQTEGDVASVHLFPNAALRSGRRREEKERLEAERRHREEKERLETERREREKSERAAAEIRERQEKEQLDVRRREHKEREFGRSSTDVGIARIFQARTRAFTEEYLVSETGPVPFGGRDLELNRLDAWLVGPNAPPRMLVTAPAGRGKSALLVQWMKILQSGGVSGPAGWQLAFMPISIRVSTNRPEVFYEGLARRLAEIIGEALPSEAIRDGDGFRYAVRDLLDRIAGSDRRVIIVIDGLDEALQGRFDAAILPVVLPPNLRILLSARWQVGDSDSKGWLKRLGWDCGVKVESFELDRLKANGIADVLVNLGAPVDIVTREPDLIERLAVLTDGEPLLVRYYAEDLWQFIGKGARVTRPVLDQLQPGFSSYFEHFDRQQELWREEKIGIDPQAVDRVTPEQRPVVLGEALASAKAIGQAYDRSDALTALAPYLTPEQLGEALAFAKALDNEYRRSKALVSLAPYLTPKQLGEALAFAKAIDNEYGRSSALAALAPYLAPERIDEALVSAKAIGDEYARSEALTALAPCLKPGQIGEAFAAAKAIGEKEARSRALTALVPHLAPEQRPIVFGEALASAKAIDNEYGRSSALAALAPYVSPEQRPVVLGEALASAKAIDNEYRRSNALAVLAPYVSPEQRPVVLGEALMAAKAIGDKDDRSRALTALALYVAPEQRAVVLGEALAAAKAIDNESRRSSALAALAPHLGSDQLGEALAAAMAIGDESQRSSALAALVPHLGPQQLGEALAAAKAIGDEDSRLQVLAALVRWLPSTFQVDALLALIDAVGNVSRPVSLSAAEAASRSTSELGGRGAVLELRRAINDACCWYP